MKHIKNAYHLLADDLDDIIKKMPKHSQAIDHKEINALNLARLYNLNEKGLIFLEKNSHIDLTYTHPRIHHFLFPYFDFSVNVWAYRRNDTVILIDCSHDGEELVQALSDQNMCPTDLLITHQHPDHIGGAPVLKEAYPRLINTNTISGLEMINTPGHCEEHTSYYFAEEGVCFCGDALFAGSMGKPNFSYTHSLDSLKKLLSLPDDTLLFPGHGPVTNVRREKEYNCFYKEYPPL